MPTLSLDIVASIDALWCIFASGPIWNPGDDDNLQLRLIVMAHPGALRHRGRSATSQVLSFAFPWSTVDDDLNLFVKHFIH